MKTDNVGYGVYQPYRHNPGGIDQSRAGSVYRPGETGRPSPDASKSLHNKPVFETSVDVSVDIGNRSMKLLLRAAIEHVNQALSREFGRDVTDRPSSPSQDYSPQAVANRIVSLSTSFFDEYRDLYPKKDLDAALKSFVRVVGGGVDKGFDEAREILDGLGALKGDVASNIDKTYEYVKSGLKSFVDNYPPQGNYPPHGNYSPHGNYPPQSGYPPHSGGYSSHGNYPRYDTGSLYGNLPRYDIGSTRGDSLRHDSDRSYDNDARHDNIPAQGSQSRHDRGPSASGEARGHSDDHRGDEKSGHKGDD